MHVCVHFIYTMPLLVIIMFADRSSSAFVYMHTVNCNNYIDVEAFFGY